MAPSSFENIYGDVAEEMSAADVQEIIQAFAEAGMRTKRAGFDAVQIHGAHTYLVNQFLSPIWNRRRDAYGGGIENRSRFLFEVYEGIREKVGEDFPILIKLSSDDCLEGGFSIDEAIWVSKRLEDVGVAAIEVSGGSRYAGVDKAPVRPGIKGEKDEVYFAENTRKIKEQVGVPVITVGGIRSFNVAEKIIQTGVADYIALSRPLICEPDLVNRWESGDRSKSKCLSDNKCLTPGYEGETVICQVRR
jgi:2,4-dienoyl-CoA reductase-like NADH-dependent reductase (Old Yellow Enzyme family)